MFMLFVYPNPVGLPFTLLRLSTIALVGYLFFQLFSATPRRERVNLGTGSDVAPPETRDMHKKEEGSLQEAIQVVLDLFAASFPEFSASAYLLNRSKKELVQWAYCGEKDSFRHSLPLENSAIHNLLVSNHPEFITPLEGGDVLSSLFRDNEDLSPSTAVLSAPIATDGEHEGILLIEADQFGDFDEDHRSISSLYADLLGLELRQYDVRSSLRSDHLFYSQIEAYQNDLDIDRPEDELITSMVRFCKRHFSFDKITVSLLEEPKSDKAIIRGVSGFTKDVDLDDSFSVSGSLHGKVISQATPVVVDDLSTDQSTEGRFIKGDLKEHPFLSFLGVPIRNKEGVKGALAIESFAPHQYSKSDLLNLQVLGERAGVLLRWWENYAAVREASMRDGLTGLLNRGAFMERFEGEISRADRYQENLVLVILDLDKFKRVNDNHGHLYGDYVIVESANSMRMSVRNIDLVARYGGEEFAIVLVNATKQGANQTCERIVSNIATRDYLKDNISIQMTISAGVSEFPSDGTSPRDLIEKADEAMYEIKRKGGNGVIFVSDDPS